VQLLEAVARGDVTAFEQLYRRHFKQLLRFAMRMVDRLDLAEEVANDALMTVWRSAESYKGLSKPSTWIFGITYRTALRARRRLGKASAEVELDDDMAGGADDGASIDAIFRKEHLARAMDQLTPDQRAVVELTYYNGYLYTEIAEIMECPVGTVKTRMMSARKRLKALLTDPELGAKETGNG
jgi:RNA polymerase sigma-70 factor (ECF subfamily)